MNDNEYISSQLNMPCFHSSRVQLIICSVSRQTALGKPECSALAGSQCIGQEHAGPGALEEKPMNLDLQWSSGCNLSKFTIIGNNFFLLSF